LAAELRWILLGLSLPLLVGIWWWTVRRSGQAPGNAELRESTSTPDPRYTDPNHDDMRPHPAPRDWGVPPFERLNIRTADFEHVPVLDEPILVDAGLTSSGVSESVSDRAEAPEMTVIPAMTAAPSVTVTSPFTVTSPITVTPEITVAPEITDAPEMTEAPEIAEAPEITEAPVTTEAPRITAAPAIAAAPESSDRLAAVTAAPSHPAELQRIVTIRVCAAGEMRWSGTQLRAALELHGLAFGRYQVFHRRHADGRSLFCVASLIEPGTFDVAKMAGQEFRGVSLFAVLPGPLPPLEMMDELVRTARGLAEALSGMVQDAKGMPMSPQRAAALREDIARFQASLARH
jgi:cell division protein ZipA